MFLNICICAFFIQFTLGQNVIHMQQNVERFLEDKKGQGAGKFAFASYYNDHMVLQRAPFQAVVWGFYPDVGTRIILKIGSLQKVYAADVEPGPTPDQGIWSVTLDPINDKGPYTITAFSETSSISIRDVLFGDVWICSGQSNMQFTTYQIFNATEELQKASNYPDVRIFTAAMEYSAVPLSDLAGIEEYWSLPSNATVGGGPFTFFSAACWLFGKKLNEELGYPIGLVDTNWGGTPVEAWSSPDALAKCGITANTFGTRESKTRKLTRLKGPGDLSQLWNAMIYPFLRMTIFGAIWYQGESDAAEPQMHHYNCTFPSMIDDWRVKFSANSGQTNPLFPFGFVQLAPNRNDPSITVGFPDIRWHQTADYGYVPNPRMINVFMSVAMDLPDFTSPWGSIHPRDKEDIAQRLFISGLQVAYNKGSPPYTGPLPETIVQSGSDIVLQYNTQNQIQVASSQGFEFCCTLHGTGSCTPENSVWQPSHVLASNISSISLDGTVCGSGQMIVGIRYAWRESPCNFKQCAVYSLGNSLPGPPFLSLKPKNNTGAEFTYKINWTQPQIIP